VLNLKMIEGGRRGKDWLGGASRAASRAASRG
jgi:hypothetical protein